MSHTGNVQDGDSSDKVWSEEMIREMQESSFDPQRVIYFADPALVTPDNLAKMAEHRMRSVSLLPETYKLAETLEVRARIPERPSRTKSGSIANVKNS